MARSGAGVRRGIASLDFREVSPRLLRRDDSEAGVLGRNVEYANAGAPRRGRELDTVFVGFPRSAVDASGALARVPHFEKQRAPFTADALRTRDGPVLDEHRVSVCIVTGHHAPHGGFVHVVYPPRVSAN